MAVEDLQLSPALTVLESTPLPQALHEARMRDFSILPVTSASRALVGYLDLRSQSGTSDQNASVGSTMRRFQRSRPYEVITPDTTLGDLDAFLRRHDFAIVSDANRKFVLAVCTRDDLSKFTERF